MIALDQLAKRSQDRSDLVVVLNGMIEISAPDKLNEYKLIPFHYMLLRCSNLLDGQYCAK